MYNKVILAGNLTRDIEIRYTPGGMAVASTGIASNRKFKSATGEQKEEVLFIDLTFFGRTAEIANQYLRKGSKVLVDGRLKLDSWTAQDGSKRSKHSVTVENLQMLSSRDEAPAGGSDYTQQNSSYNTPTPEYNTPNATSEQPSQYQQKAPEPNIPEIDISEDEIPF
jgi:single-strand DNA-binding protein